MPTCHLCNKKFPCEIKIDGKIRNVASRKYCLECSPFGLHNTKKLISPKLLEQQQEDNEPRQTCCRCHQTLPIENFYLRKTKNGIAPRYECKSCWNQIIKQQTRNRKKKAIDFLGGKCSICGYNKCQEALDFHHLDPEQKDGSITVHKSGWNIILEELKKCILVCANCHREIHAEENKKLIDPLFT